MELVYISADLALALIFCYEQQFQALVQAIIAARPPCTSPLPWIARKRFGCFALTAPPCGASTAKGGRHFE